ncbi:MAG: CinA family protein [Thermoplasmatota archaeon]
MTDYELIQTISHYLTKHNLTIATAESCTGGLLSHYLTDIPGSSDYFEQGIVSYSNRSKEEMLAIPHSIIKNYGAVSQEVAQAMAQGIKKIAHVDIGLSTTGIAGPGGGTKTKPVGLVYIAIATPKTTMVHHYQFKGDRLENKKQTCREALKLLQKVLENW